MIRALALAAVLLALIGCGPAEAKPPAGATERVVQVSRCSDCVDEIWFVETDVRIYIVSPEAARDCPTEPPSWWDGEKCVPPGNPE